MLVEVVVVVVGVVVVVAVVVVVVVVVFVLVVVVCGAVLLADFREAAWRKIFVGHGQPEGLRVP